MKKFLNIQTLIVLVILFLPALAHADPTDPGADPDVPVDGGLSLLLAAGVGYGIKKVKDNYNKEKK
ncbi:MAG: hypothetical protein ORN55_02785 [Chitinophagaceae bacterium]|nr:hypothetical protein [Chitinophagaceae bacterium]